MTANFFTKHTLQINDIWTRHVQNVMKKQWILCAYAPRNRKCRWFPDLINYYRIYIDFWPGCQKCHFLTSVICIDISDIPTKSQCKCYSNWSGLEIIDIFDFEGLFHHILNVSCSYIINLKCVLGEKIGGHTFLESVFDGDHDAHSLRSPFWVLRCEKVAIRLRTSITCSYIQL